MDDLTFRNRLLETGVLSTKDDTKWSFDILIELLEGPLRNPKRLDEAMRASKFMKRVLGFFQPLSFRYSDTRKDEVRSVSRSVPRCVTDTVSSHRTDDLEIYSTRLHHDQYASLGSWRSSIPRRRQVASSDRRLLTPTRTCTPLTSIDSQQTELMSFSARIQAGVSVSGGDVLFSKERIESTLVSGYFEILGEMTKSSAGLAFVLFLFSYFIFSRLTSSDCAAFSINSRSSLASTESASCEVGKIWSS